MSRRRDADARDAARLGPPPRDAGAPPAPADDLVVLVDDDDRPLGAAPRLAVHDAHTPLHRAFSLYLVDERGEVLITRRALGKSTWPGVWTNACCGHPRPDEPPADAVRRRLREELGVEVDALACALPAFRYRAVDAGGVVENENCPVFVGRIRGELRPDPDEVAQHAWVRWEDLVKACRATPEVYSPWSVLQVAALAAAGGVEVLIPHQEAEPSAEATFGAVDALLEAEGERLEGLWQRYAPRGVADVIGAEPGDLPTWLRSLRAAGGKRIRTQMCHWGFVASGGALDSPQHAQVVRSAAALETLHLFALIHDDVMDGSVTRRGVPAAHVVAAERHRQLQAHGSSERFGESLAILLGDLAHSEADRLTHTLPLEMRDYWYDLCLELIVGQRADLTGGASGRTDRAHAEQVAALKSGAYSIQRPLHLGALAAGASPEQSGALERFGHHLGRAFAWRDDVLGVWGDSARTGKPVGDDLREGKATLIWVLGVERLTGRDAVAMRRVGTLMFADDDVHRLQRALEEAGVRDEMERLIDAEVEAAEAILDGSPLTPAGIAGLRGAAHDIAWRST